MPATDSTRNETACSDDDRCLAPAFPLRIGINGYGRIGRCLLRVAATRCAAGSLSVVAINEPAPLSSIAHLTQYDSIHGVYAGTVGVEGGRLIVDGRPIDVTHARYPEELDWSPAGVDLLVEASGRYSTRASLQSLLDAGCPRVLLSRLPDDDRDVDRTPIVGFNDHALTGRERLVSAASCTSSAIVPVLVCLDDAFGLETVMLTTFHSMMNDQPVLDGYHGVEPTGMRAAMRSIIPCATGLARGVTRLLPHLAGRVDATALRVPVFDVSAVELTAELRHSVSTAAVNTLLQEETARRFRGTVTCSSVPHASADFAHSPLSATVDMTQTRVVGRSLVRCTVWFDNEWGYVNRLLDLALLWHDRLMHDSSAQTSSNEIPGHPLPGAWRSAAPT